MREGRDPVQVGRLEIGRDARLGQDAAIADHGQPLDAEALAQLVDLGTERAGIGGVAGEDRDRTAVCVAQQAVSDLGPVQALVARMAAPGEWAAGTFEMTGRGVVQCQAAVLLVELGELALDGGLALRQPVHGVVEFVDGGVGALGRVSRRGLAGGSELAFEAQLGTELERARIRPRASERWRHGWW